MEFLGSSYEGERTEDGKRFHGLGQYTFPNGDRYVGGFHDGQFHGAGVIFYRKRNTEVTAEDGGGHSCTRARRLSGPTQDSTAADSEEWDGQYRGVWEYGRVVSGNYVFKDGLVHSGHIGKNVGFMEGSEEWSYCQSSDRRLWAEHLRNITPVLPYETVLGGSILQTHAVIAKGAHERRWTDVPILVPSSCETEMVPDAFESGQPRGGDSVPRQFWNDAEQRTAVTTLISLETPPLVAEEDPDRYDMITINSGDGGGRKRTVENPNLHERFLLPNGHRNRLLAPSPSRV